MKKSDLSSQISRISKPEMRKKKKKMLYTEQETEAALQLIHLNNTLHTCPITHTTNSHHHVDHEPSMNRVREIYDSENINHSISTWNIWKRKSDGLVSCCSSITFDLADNCDEDAGEAVAYVKKIKKFRSISDLYNVTKPF